MQKLSFYKDELLPWLDGLYKTASMQSLLNDLKTLYPNDDRFKYSKDNPKSDTSATDSLWFVPVENSYICYYMYKVQADENDKELTQYARLEGITIMERGHNFPKSYVILYKEDSLDNNINDTTSTSEIKKNKQSRPDQLGYTYKDDTMISLLKDIKNFNCPELFNNGLYSFGDGYYQNLNELKEYAERQKSKIIKK